MRFEFGITSLGLERREDVDAVREQRLLLVAHLLAHLGDLAAAFHAGCKGESRFELVFAGDHQGIGEIQAGGVHADATKELYVNGDIYATGTSTSASDVRFKRNVTSITDALEVARRARAVTFSFQTDAFPERRFPKHAQAGVVAQELEAVLPDLVSTDDRGYKGVAYERIGDYALAAVKELDEEVRSLRATLEAVRKTLERIHDA